MVTDYYKCIKFLPINSITQFTSIIIHSSHSFFHIFDSPFHIFIILFLQKFSIINKYLKKRDFLI